MLWNHKLIGMCDSVEGTEWFQNLDIFTLGELLEIDINTLTPTVSRQTLTHTLSTLTKHYYSTIIVHSIAVMMKIGIFFMLIASAD